MPSFANTRDPMQIALPAAGAGSLYRQPRPDGWRSGFSAIAVKLTPNRVRCRGRRHLMIRLKPGHACRALVGSASYHQKNRTMLAAVGGRRP